MELNQTSPLRALKATPADYKAIFEDDRRGAAILADLLKLFVKGAVTTGGIDAVLTTYLREGQRVPLDWIFKQINRANGADDDQPQPEVTE